MPLDPEVRSFLKKLADSGTPSTSSLTPEEARAQCLAESKTMGEAEPVARVEDRTAPGPGGPIPIRLYTPEGNGPFGVLVYYHGGGWVTGDIRSHDGIARAMANAAGCIVASVDYRLAPEHKYPAAVDDAYAAAQWVFEQAGNFGGDPRRVALGGDSAGGNLAAAVALMARDRDASQAVFQVLVYPVTDYCFDTPSYSENAEGYLLTREGMRWCWNHYLAQEEDGSEVYASPLRATDFAGLPPALVITAEYDPLRDEGEAYARRLREAGVPVALTRYDGMVHGFFRRLPTFTKARVAVAEVAAALRQTFS